MSARYAPLPNPRSIRDAERELDDAFGAENDDDIDASETTPFTRRDRHPRPSSNQPGSRTSVLGAYDFEQEREYNYDQPPPGSPPRPSAFALPNDIGNTNGLLPTSPARIPVPRISLFRRAVGAVGAILPTHYTRIPGEPSHSRVVGGGLENDGVFANVTAKPGRAREVHTEDGELHLVPEDAPKDVPPSYAAAQLDAVPPYWETTIHAPGMNPGIDMIIDDLPSGSLWIFVLNLLISFFFQLVGFLLTYLLHTSHAAKYGSRAGLGLTLIQFGFYTRTSNSAPESTPTPDDVSHPHAGTFGSPLDPSGTVPETIPAGGMSSREWMAFIMMTLGWFILLSSAAGYWRVKHWEASIRSTNPAPMTVEEIERDIAIRRNLEIQDPDSEAARLTRNLEQAGFI